MFMTGVGKPTTYRGNVVYLHTSCPSTLHDASDMAFIENIMLGLCADAVL